MDTPTCEVCGKPVRSKQNCERVVNHETFRPATAEEIERNSPSISVIVVGQDCWRAMLKKAAQSAGLGGTEA